MLMYGYDSMKIDMCTTVVLGETGSNAPLKTPKSMNAQVPSIRSNTVGEYPTHTLA